MADINNLSELNDNFDTIKTLLNSIRAQGILNTSDVDKLLSGINTKLEKINTEEDIDLIKVFLSELKQNLDERHNVLLSKFGAIESLFTNLLKNSNEMLKSSEVKELFDIVATNLSVFSREVVSQKDVLTDIILRIDSMRSDDSQKKDIIKSLSPLKTDLEHLINAFDSIVLSLNENFKTIIKTISSIDPSEAISKFSEDIKDVVASSTTLLSAIQLVDKKNDKIEDALKDLATQDELANTKRHIVELLAQNQNLANTLDVLNEKYYKMDNLADKIDASVNIIAGLKSAFSESNEEYTEKILEELAKLDSSVRSISTDSEFEEFKSLFDTLITRISETSENISKVEKTISERVNSSFDRLSQFVDVSITRTLNDISENAKTLEELISKSQLGISDLCSGKFSEIVKNISDLKYAVSQIDENNTSANNAIFSNVTDRLAMFENSLKSSFERQEDVVSNSSSKLYEEISNIKNLSGVLDYKLDSSVIEINNAKNEYSELKTAVNNLLELDFVNVVKDLKVDLYASKQELATAFENSTGELSDKFSNDLFGKYELLISKLDNVEDEVKRMQAESYGAVKQSLDNIASSIIDVLSYVSKPFEDSSIRVDAKLADLTEVVKESNLNYVENVRDIVDIIRRQVENNLIQINSEFNKQLDSVNSSILNTASDIKEEIKYSYNKLIEVQDSFKEIKDILGVNQLSLDTNLTEILKSTDVCRQDFDSKLNALKNALLDNVTEFKNDFVCQNAEKFSEIKFVSESLNAKSEKQSVELKAELKQDLENIIAELKINISDLAEQVANSILSNQSSNKDLVSYIKNDFYRDLDSSLEVLKSNISDFEEGVNCKVSEVLTGFSSMENTVNDLSQNTTSTLAATLAQILDNFVAIKALLKNVSDKNADDIDKGVGAIISDFAELKKLLTAVDSSIDEDLTRQLSLIETNFETLTNRIAELFTQTRASFKATMDEGLGNISDRMQASLLESLEGYKAKIEDTFANLIGKTDSQSEFIKERVLELNTALEATLAKQNDIALTQISEVAMSLKNVLDENVKITAADYEQFRKKVEILANNIEECNKNFSENLNSQLEDIMKFVNSGMEIQSKEVNSRFDDIAVIASNLTNLIDDINSKVNDKVDSLKSEVVDLGKIVENNSVNSSAELSNIASSVSSELTDVKSQFEDKIAALNVNLNDAADKFKHNVQDLEGTINSRLDSVLAANSDITNKLELSAKDLKDAIGDRFDSLQVANTDVANKLALNVKELEETISGRLDSVLASSADIAAGELQSMENFANKIIDEVENAKKNSVVCKDLIAGLIKENIEILSNNIEKETDVIVKDLIEQFNLLKDEQKDEFSKLTIHVESSIEDYIYNYINDLKSFMDMKTDTSVLNNKLDNLKVEMDNSVESVLSNINKMLDAGVFASSVSDLKTTNEILINSMAETINNKLQSFIKVNVSDSFAERINLLDKKFVDTVVDKYMEMSLVLSAQENSLEGLRNLVDNSANQILSAKESISNNMIDLFGDINGSIDDLKSSFADLKAQILNKSFDEAFQASVNKQISDLENLVKEQFGYLEDISDLCCTNLPELTEMNTLVKYGISETINNISEKLDSQEVNVQKELNDLKSEIITQFINLFNQISFVAEQEEILDFIQEKHSDLITILSHIVNSVDSIDEVRGEVAAVDNKIDSLKDDIAAINTKISSIISSENDVNYIYSLQDLESDIANLRIVLNEMKEDNKSKEFEDLVNSTNEIYKFMESLSDDVVSISTRTNQLLLSSDESYKVLQDNLQDFKLVINDFDERTRNFAQEAGLDRIDSKLGTLNQMIQQGAKTNQVFNQVFEYLAEWVDNAGVQISTISDKVDSLDSLGQIKVMLEDLKAEAADNNDSAELIEALGNVFEKQGKRIASLEAKLDRMIVENTINAKNNKLDLSPFEDTLNRFLVAIDDKMALQQDRIDSLESKLSEAMSLMDPKDTAQLTKKVGGMDRQIAKLNKSIEKIASHVVEK